MTRLTLCTLVLLAASCKERDPLYCKTSADCKDPGRPLCDLTGTAPGSEGLANTCVGIGSTDDGGLPFDAGRQCPAACPTSQPFCDPTTKECRPCAVDGECGSRVCDIDTGECVPESAILYVARGGATVTPCGTASTPCEPLPLALQQLGAGKTTLHVGPGTYPDAIVLRGVQATVVGDGAVIDPSALGQPPLEVSDAAGLATNLLVRNIALRGGASGTVGERGSGVHCTAGPMPVALRLVGVDVADNEERGVYNENCTLSITRSSVQRNVSTGVLSVGGRLTIADSVLRNNAAGVTCIGCSLVMERNLLSVGVRWALSLQESTALVTPFKIVNNVFHGFVDNGSQGVIDIRGSNYGPTQFEFNTVASSTGRLVNCYNAAAAIRTVIRNSIVFGDYDVSGNSCRMEYSLTKTAVSGDGNVVGDPQFVNPGSDFRLQATSPARNAANNTEGITSDLDGRSRPSGRQADIGAFELP